MNSNDEKRLKIRAFFFPLSKPKEPNDSWWYWVTSVVLIGVIGGVILTLITGEGATCAILLLEEEL